MPACSGNYTRDGRRCTAQRAARTTFQLDRGSCDTCGFQFTCSPPASAVHKPTLDPKGLAACRQNRNPWAEPGEHFGQGRCRPDEVLAICRGPAAAFCPDGTRDGLGRGAGGPGRQPERSRRRGWHEGGIRQRRQFDEPTAVGEIAEDTASRSAPASQKPAVRGEQGQPRNRLTRERA
jgi:hypothetical protein